MSVALYRKYRPQNFSDVTNQNHIKVTLQNEIESGRLGHAYLFCGPRGTGKTTLARLLSKAVNCLDLQPNGEACNKCEICQEILNNKSLDIIEIDAASHTGVDNVRENIINNARFTPTRNKYKVFIIDEVHMLSISAFNALLKILEEPPKYVIFILATTEAHKVPATIISRCQRFDFKKIIVSEIADRLRWISKQEEISVDDKVLSLIAKQAGGCVRDAESLLEQVFSLGEKNITLEQAELILPKSDYDLFYQLFDLIVKKNKAEAIIFINKLVADGIDVTQFVDGFIEFLRKILLFKVTDNLENLSQELDETTIKKVIENLAGVSQQALIQMIEKLLVNQDVFKQNYLIQLPLEIAVLELCSDERVEPVVMRPEPVKAPPVVNPTPPVAHSVAPDVKKVEVEPAPAADPVVEAKEPIQEVKKVAPQIPRGSSADLNAIMSAWPTVLSTIKEGHYSIYMSLHMGKPISCADNKIIIGFLFELQRSRIDDIKAKSVVRETINNVMGQQFELELIVDPTLTLSDLPKNGNGGGGLAASVAQTTPAVQEPEIEPESASDAAPAEPKGEAEEVADQFGGTVVG